MERTEKISPKSNLISRHYYNVTQFRIDVWNSLKQAAYRLVKLPARHPDLKEVEQDLTNLFGILDIMEPNWAFPGPAHITQLKLMHERGEYPSFAHALSSTVRQLVSESYRDRPVIPDFNRNLNHMNDEEDLLENEGRKEVRVHKNYFEVLFVDMMSAREEDGLRKKIAEIRHSNDKFVYDVVTAGNFQDAMVALLFNYNIQSCVIRYGIPYKTERDLRFLKPFISWVFKINLEDETNADIALILGMLIRKTRPEIDLYFVTDLSLNQTDEEVLRIFRRIFYRQEDMQELHLSILRGITERFEAPFFTALTEFSQRPTGVFHAMPISRGNSIFKSRWIRDMGEFYGRNIFLAETSATTGGLDSLLQPTGPLKEAQKLAAKAFGAQSTYFVTNGTSTANKIVQQALVQPGDIVLVDRDCHKSHHYALVLSGATVVYLDSYPVEEYSLYGAVPLSEIKTKLLKLKEDGRLHRVKMLILTNCTFDGLVHNVERIMEEVLAIKSDMIFLWDEAWYAFAYFTKAYRQRTAMYVAKKLREKYSSQAYRTEYKAHMIGDNGTEVSILPDPAKVKIRVYSTQSTHKTLSSLRQGSMIHIWDEDFRMKTEDSFLEAYMTHTSTSANYQILASLDMGRRQVMFEGFELVIKAIEMAMTLRERITNHPQIRRYFRVLSISDLIPAKYRESKLNSYYDSQNGWNSMEKAWRTDELTLDPTKITLYVGKTGVDGDTFKNRYLMDQYGIQVNKTSRNTVLLMTNIGTTRSSVAYLIRVLLRISQQLDDERASFNKVEKEIHKQAIVRLTKELPSLPDFSRFHDAFQPVPGSLGGNIRDAFFLAYDESKCEYIKLEDCEAMMDKREMVSAAFITPYPPGFPVLVPGQILSKEILEFMNTLDVKEIHGYRPELGLRFFTDSAVQKQITKIRSTSRKRKPATVKKPAP